MPLVLPSLLWSLLGAAPVTPESLCAGRAPCRVVEVLDAGGDARGPSPRVVHLDLGWFSYDDAPEKPGRKLGPGRRAKGSLEEEDCAAAEWWLLTQEPPRLLLSVCNDGYGGAGRGEDVMKVKNGLLSHMRIGGGGQRWSHTRVWRLSPLERVREGHINYLGDGEEPEDSIAWDYTTLQGSRYLGPATCEEGPSAPDKRTLPFLPRVAMDAAYLEEGWKKVGLGACALTARSPLLGKPRNARDASLKALLVSPDTLILEVRDDVWAPPSEKGWQEDDHIQLWLGRQSPERLTGCGKPEGDERPMQWAIRVSDGLVFPAYGPPRGTLAVERVELRASSGALEGYRLKVKLQLSRPDFEGLALVYVDRDGGLKAERMVATSPLKFGRPETLNIPREVPAREATCVARGKETELRVVPTPVPLPAPDVSVLPSEPRE